VEQEKIVSYFLTAALTFMMDAIGATANLMVDAAAIFLLVSMYGGKKITNESDTPVPT